ESALPDATRIATAAGAAELVRLITGHRGAEIHAEPHTLADDLRLRQADERCVHATRVSLDCGARCKHRHFFKRADELCSAVGVPRIIDCVYTDENVRCAEHFRPAECESQQQRIT